MRPIKRESQIPQAEYYVLANDRWPEDKIGTTVFPCKTRKEADTVASNARRSCCMKYVRVVENKPRLRKGIHYALMGRDSLWYARNGSVDDLHHERARQHKRCWQSQQLRYSTAMWDPGAPFKLKLRAITGERIIRREGGRAQLTLIVGGRAA